MEGMGNGTADGGALGTAIAGEALMGGAVDDVAGGGGGLIGDDVVADAIGIENEHADGIMDGIAENELGEVIEGAGEGLITGGKAVIGAIDEGEGGGEEAIVIDVIGDELGKEEGGGLGLIPVLENGKKGDTGGHGNGAHGEIAYVDADGVGAGHRESRRNGKESNDLNNGRSKFNFFIFVVLDLWLVKWHECTTGNSRNKNI
jgi:hypothetical protein